MAKISIIIPHLNGKHHLDDCLGSLRRQTFTDFEVLLVDNGSTDGTQAYVSEQFPEVTILELGRNFGFTGACNAGWDASSGEIVILLNNDTETDEGWHPKKSTKPFDAIYHEILTRIPKRLPSLPPNHCARRRELSCSNR